MRPTEGAPAPPGALAGERLRGCTASTLDAYLRGLGFLAVAGRVDPDVRGWWDEDEVLRIAAVAGVDGLIERLAAAPERVRELAGVVETPWRGKQGRWAVVRRASQCGAGGGARLVRRVRRAGGHRRREAQQPFGQGGGFGRSELVPAFEESLRLLERQASNRGLLGELLAALLRGEPLDRRAVRALAIHKKVLGPYQSGRGTGPGSSVRDVDPSGQSAWTIAWDIVLIFSGLRLFKGAPTRRPGSRRS